MSLLVQVLMFVYLCGLTGGVLCGMSIGFLVAVLWGLARCQRRRQRQVSAEQFSRELDAWVREIEEEKANTDGSET